MVAGLRTLGVRAEERPDGAVIEGRDAFSGGVIESHGDHRIAMAFAVASLRAQDAIVIHDTAEVATSFPGFVTTAGRAGLALEAVEGEPR
jgi:3-phosphoshikimate 1-carboxyvinyltransferase